jgi:hypothetical protein
VNTKVDVFPRFKFRQEGHQTSEYHRPLCLPAIYAGGARLFVTTTLGLSRLLNLKLFWAEPIQA